MLFAAFPANSRHAPAQPSAVKTIRREIFIIAAAATVKHRDFVKQRLALNVLHASMEKHRRAGYIFPVVYQTYIEYLERARLHYARAGDCKLRGASYSRV